MIRKNIAIALAVFAFFVLAGVATMSPSHDVSAAPAALPTALSVSHPGTASNVVTFFDATGVTTSTFVTSNAQNVQNATKIDLHTVLDHSTANTVTIKLQFSNDGVNWVDGQTAVTASEVDYNELNQYLVFGRYARLHADTTNTSLLTITAIGVAK